MSCSICDPKVKYNNCICAESWKDFDETMGIIKNVSSEDLSESLRISTITLCLDLNSSVNCDTLINEYPPKNNGKFYNSFIFNWHTKYQFRTLVSVKVFPNGKIQVAGLSSIRSCAYIIRKIQRKLTKHFNNPLNVEIKNVKIAMINSDFKISNIFNLVNFCKVLSENSIKQNGNFLNIVYQPIKYPAINSKFIPDSSIDKYNEHIYKFGNKKKFTGNISILIFRSGSIIITGGNSINEYLSTYKYLLELINTRSSEIFV